MRITCFFLIIILTSSVANGQQDSVRSDISEPNVFLQIAGGAATITGCYYALQPKNYFTLFPVIMPVVTGGIIGGIGELTSNRSGSYWVSILGAFAGELMGYSIGYAVAMDSKDIVKYSIVAIPVLALSCFPFNVSLKPKLDGDDVGSLIIAPWHNKEQVGLSLVVKY